MEIWDLFGPERQPLFRTHRRGEKLNFGEYHIDVEVWVVNNEKKVLVTLRSPQKEQYPNKWEVTGGSALAGETSKQAAIRELREEVGIIAKADELELLGTYQDHVSFTDIFLLHCDVLISKLKMQEGETVYAKWITLEELNEIIENKTFALPIAEHFKTIIKNALYKILK